MPEEDALDFLHQKGFTIDNVPGAGDSFGWSHSFLLADGYWMTLEVSPETVRADGKWLNGRLRAAYIQRHGGNVFTIKLRNPAQQGGSTEPGDNASVPSRAPLAPGR
jgi:hypothetical protein